jgi:hypothetical protein
MNNLFNKLKKLLHKKKDRIVFTVAITQLHKGDHIVPNPQTNPYPCGLGPNPRQAVNQDVSRFMKHGRQNRLYRHAVRAHINPEDEDIP